MLSARRVTAHLSGGPGQPGLDMGRVGALLRFLFLSLALALTPDPLARLADGPRLGPVALGAFLVLAFCQLLVRSDATEREEQRRQILFTLELLALSALVYLYAASLPLLFVLFFFPVVGFFQPVSIRSSLFAALFLSAVYLGMLQISAPEDARSAAAGSLLILGAGVLVGYLGEKGRWNSAQMRMFRNCVEILKRDVSFDELLADLLREVARYYQVERVLLVSPEADGGPGRLKQVRSVDDKVLYEEIEFLREEVHYLFPVELFSGFYVNRVGEGDQEGAQVDFLDNRTLERVFELPKIFYTLFNAQSVLSTPILRQDRALGRLFIINRRQGRFTRKDIHFLKQLCDQHFRAVLENLQLMEKSKALAVLEERNRIAMDLHDSFIQTLATLDLRLEVSRRILEKDTRAGLDEMRRISQMVKSEYLELRRYMNKLRSQIPEVSKLEELLDGFVRKFQDDHGLPVEITIQRSRGPLAEALRSEIFQIVREGLMNVVRHARATKATVSIDVGEEEINICIQDDGQGMSVHNGDGSPGVVRPWTILQRTQRLSGKLEVDSVPGEGTRISVSIPLRRKP